MTKTRAKTLILPALLLLSLGAPSLAQRADKAIDPRSLALAKKGDALAKAGNGNLAEDLYEAALAVDPRNGGAFVAIAELALRDRLYGKAVRMSAKALSIDPADRDALGVKGRALAAMGAGPKARETLGELKKACGSAACPQAATLAAAIARGADPVTKPVAAKS